WQDSAWAPATRAGGEPEQAKRDTEEGAAGCERGDGSTPGKGDQMFFERRRVLLSRLDIEGPIRGLPAWQRLQRDVHVAVARVGRRSPGSPCPRSAARRGSAGPRPGRAARHRAPSGTPVRSVPAGRAHLRAADLRGLGLSGAVSVLSTSFACFIGPV